MMGISQEPLGGGGRWLLLVMVRGSRLGVSEKGQVSRISGGPHPGCLISPWRYLSRR